MHVMARLTRGLEHPPLGLVLMLAAAVMLPQYAGIAVSVGELDSWHEQLGSVLMLELATLALQVATGAAIAWRWHARPIFAVYAAMTCAVAIVGVHATDDGAGQAAALAVESIGWPVIVLGVSWWLPLVRERGASEVAAVLIAVGVSGLIGTGLTTSEDALMFAHSHAWGGWLAQALLPATGIASAVLAILAGLRLTRGRFLAYLFVTIGVRAVWVLFTIGYGLVIGEYGSRRGMIFEMQIVGFATSIISPLALWAYASDQLDGSGRAAPKVLAWTLLGFAPVLLARCFLISDLTHLGGTTVGWTVAIGCAVLAIVLAAAALATLREAPIARPLAALAAIAALAVGAIAVIGYYAAPHEHLVRRPFGALGLLLGVAVTMAWLQRRRR
jgi:hypothetical protein